MIIAVDASALVAIGLDEPERLVFEPLLLGADEVWATPINLVEAGIILAGRQAMARENYGSWLADLGVAELAVGGEEALQAYLRFGRGIHPAKLNLGDCFAYALAMRLNAPLLFKGDDFPKTDVRSALS